MKKLMVIFLGVFAIVAVGLATTQDVKSLFDSTTKPAVAEAPVPVAVVPTVATNVVEVKAPVETKAVEASAPVDDCCATETPLNAKIGETGPRLGQGKGQGMGGGACAMEGQAGASSSEQCADCQ